MNASDSYQIDEGATVGYNYAEDSKRPIIGSESTIRAGTVVYDDVVIGEQFSTGHSALIRELTDIGVNVLVGTNTVIDGRTTIGSNVSLQTGVYVPTETQIGNNVFLGPHAVLTNDPYPGREDVDLAGPTIEDHVSVGANATILPDVTVGQGAFVAAGAVVVEDIPEETLAVGTPARYEPLPDALQGEKRHLMIPIANPELGAAEKDRVEAVLDSGMLADGPEVREFEAEFADYCGTDHGVATSNGTTALHATLEALGIGDGDRVLTTPFSFIATANAIRLAGADPVFADIDPVTYNLDPNAAHTVAREDGIDAILVVHLYGLPAKMGPLVDLAEDLDVPLVEDAAQAHGAEYDGDRVGSIGDAGCFSFYPTKNTETEVLVLGLSYRPGVEEIRASPAIPISEALSDAGADVYGIDPILDGFDAFDLTSIKQWEIYDRQFDGVVLVTPHQDFESIRWGDLERDGGQLVVIDGRDTLELTNTDHRVYTIGGGYDV